MKNFLYKLFSFATLTLIVALTLSAIAAWYSVLGLTAIFAGAVVPVIIMGGSLEIAKVVTTVWLHRYWNRCGRLIKFYLVPAVITLAFITSMGIFGFLSKAHSDQTLVSGDAIAQVQIYDEKIQVARENIETSRAALRQLDEQVNQVLARTDNLGGANRAVQIRRQQTEERNRLLAEIEKNQEIITKLNEEAAPIKAKFRKVEAEVGPIKYIAAMIYGDNPDANLLEKAVRWVIIIIVLVFDPLALTMVIAAQKSYGWLNEDLKNKKETEKDELAQNKFHKNKVTKVEPEATVVPEITFKTKYKEEVSHDEQNINDSDELAGEKLPEIFSTPDSKNDDILDRGETEIVTEPEEIKTKEIKTEGVTFLEVDDNYVNYNGKTSSKQALSELRPDLFTEQDQVKIGFGTKFPPIAKKGEVFVRVDSQPNRTFVFDGYKWNEKKDNLDKISYSQQYIKYLIDKIHSGEYSIDLLTDKEKEQIEQYVTNLLK
jgi:hypothetical protein